MTADRLAALLHEFYTDFQQGGCGGTHITGQADCQFAAARLAARGVTVGLDVDRLAAALPEVLYRDELDSLGGADTLAAAIARAYAATPQPAEEECR